MSSRAATILAIAAVISSLCYAGLAQVPEPERKATEGAILPPPIRLGWSSCFSASSFLLGSSSPSLGHLFLDVLHLLFL